MFNVIADGWTNGEYCLLNDVKTLEEASAIAKRYTDRYDGRLYPNGKGRYTCTNFRPVMIVFNNPLVKHIEIPPA